MDREKITFVISSLGSGGAEKNLAMLANYLNDNGWECTIIIFNKKVQSFYKKNKNIKIIPLALHKESSNFLSGFLNNLKRVKILRKKLKELKPNVIISFMDRTNILTLIAKKPLKYPLIISERIDPRYHKIGKIWDYLRKKYYPFADKLIVQTESVKKWALSFLKENQIEVIPNPVVFNEHKEENNGKMFPDRNTIISVGRLEKQKGFSILIEVFAKIAKKYNNWQLVIIGEGSERKNLEMLIKKLNLQEKIFLLGRIQNPIPYLRKSKMFVMTSQYEGFPNALLEAMAVGLPVVSFDCPSGPSDIIKNGENGILVPLNDTKQLYDEITYLIKDKKLREKLGKNALSVNELFGYNKIMSNWLKIIKEILIK